MYVRTSVFCSFFFPRLATVRPLAVAEALSFCLREIHGSGPDPGRVQEVFKISEDRVGSGGFPNLTDRVR